MSLANKYRPIDFDSTIWQTHISSILKSKIQNNNQTNCNYIFYWPRWTWKTSTARILSKAMNCLDLHDGNPCNQCANCIAINEWKTLDYVEIDAASYTWVDNIRTEILDKVEYAPTQLKKKIYVIDEVHMLSKSAFNALLKTIEEPKDYLVFILATTDIHKVPDTVLSRCQVFNFKKVWTDDMVSRLEYICKQENLQYEIDAFKLIARISEWCMRDAVKYVDQVSIFGNISVENVTNFLWIAWDSLIQDFLQTIKSKDREKIFEMIDNIHNRWIDLTQFTKQIIIYIDQNLTTDTDFLLQISEIFGEINSIIRYYPYPNIAYKIAINKFLMKETSISLSNENKSRLSDIPLSKVDQGGSSSINLSNENKSRPSNIPLCKGDHGGSSNIPLMKGDEGGSSNNEEKNKTIDLEQIKQILISKLKNPTTKNSIKDYVFIKWIEHNIITLIIINKIAEFSIKKDEKEIENILKEITWQQLVIQTQFQDKNEFFASQLL